MASMQNVSTKEEFDAAIAAAGEELTVVEFWQTDVPVIESILNAGEETFTDIAFISVNMNAETASEIAEQVNVTSAPTLVLLKGGEEKGRLDAGYDADAVRELLEAKPTVVTD